MATRLSARERKLLALSPNQKARNYGGLALELNELVEELVNLQDKLIYKSFTNEIDDNEILEQKILIDNLTKEADQLFSEVMGVEEVDKEIKAYVKR